MPHQKAIAITFESLNSNWVLDEDMCEPNEGETASERRYIDARCKLIRPIREALAELRKRAEAGEFD